MSHSPSVYTPLEEFLRTNQEVLRLLLAGRANGAHFAFSLSKPDRQTSKNDTEPTILKSITLMKSWGHIGSDIHENVGRSAHEQMTLIASWDAFVSSLPALMDPIIKETRYKEDAHYFLVDNTPGRQQMQGQISVRAIDLYLFYPATWSS